MSAHYKQPMLLIEWEEHKSFSLDVRPYLPLFIIYSNILHSPPDPLSSGELILTSNASCISRQAIAEVKSYAKASNKYLPKKPSTAGPSETKVASPSIQSKLVLLTLTFPRLRIIWSSSPYATAEIFNDLKALQPEPDPLKAVVVGAEDDPAAAGSIGSNGANMVSVVNMAAEELLRTLPGVTAKNVKHVMGKVGSVKELCELELKEVQQILGVEPGKACWDFIHRGDRK